LVGLLLLAVGMQAEPPRISASIDRATLAVGEELILTIRASTRSDVPPLYVQVPMLDGFELISRSERTEVAFDPTPLRSTVIQIRLRATRVGLLTIGSAFALQGPHRVEAGEIEVEVIDAKGAVAATLNPRVARVLNRGPPSGLGGKVALQVLLSSDTVLVGEQVDMVTVAWIPRDLRLRLRRPPTLEQPTVEGMWTYPQPTPVGIAASRMVDGVWYELFISHEVVFPLAPGDHAIEPAMLRYSVPLALQFFSQEERLSLASPPANITALPLPERGQPADFSGSVARGLELGRTVTPSIGRAGEPLTVDMTLEGEGNLSLWSEPAVRWPPGVRSYPDQSEERVQPIDGRIAGSKRFRYVVIPDSAGTMVLPAVTYSYYDTRSRSYRDATVPAARIAVAPPSARVSTRALPPPLRRPTGAPLMTRIGNAIPLPLMVVIWFLPVAVFVSRRLPWRRLRRSAPRTAPSSEQVVEAELHNLLRHLVPDVDDREDHALVEALRMSGEPTEIAERLVALRRRFREERYGPARTGAATRALVGEVQELVREVRGRGPRRGWHRGAMTAFMLLLLVSAPMSGQGPSPETLYETGALHAAADGFQARVARDPESPANWYNLGAAHYRLGQEARAAWAWNNALRLDPRNGAIRRALQLVAPPDRASANLLSVPPVTAQELVFLATLVWLAAWLGLTLRPAWARRWAVGLGAAVLMSVGAAWITQRDAAPIAIVVLDTHLRVAPHERAPELTDVSEGAVVQVTDSTGGWWLVRSSSDQLGWLMGAEMAKLGRENRRR